MKNSDEWIAEIKEKVSLRYAKRKKRRVIFLRSVSFTAALILVIAGVIVYPKLIQRHPDMLAQSKNPSEPNSTPANQSPQAASSVPENGNSVNRGEKTAGLADIVPNITYNQSHYDMSGNIMGDDPGKFIGDYIQSINGYFVHKGPGATPLETDKLYNVAGFSSSFVICADTSAGWEFFINDKYGNQNEKVTGAELYGETGLNLLNQYVSASYYLNSKHSASVTELQRRKLLNLPASDHKELFNYLATQPFAPIAYRGECNLTYRIGIKLNNGTTVSVNLWEYSNQYSTDSFIEFNGCFTQLNSQLKQIMADACT